jgi:hypothetical protein
MHQFPNETSTGSHLTLRGVISNNPLVL